MSEQEQLRKQQQQVVREKCKAMNEALQNDPVRKEMVRVHASDFTQGILANPVLMQMLIGNAMGSKPSSILKPHELPMPTMADVQAAILTAVDMGYRASLQHDLMSEGMHLMTYNHCNFPIPAASELTQPSN